MKELRLTGVWNASSPRAETRLRQSATDRYRVSKTKSIRLRLYHGTCFLSRDLLQIYRATVQCYNNAQIFPFVLLTTGMRLQKKIWHCLKAIINSNVFTVARYHQVVIMIGEPFRVIVFCVVTKVYAPLQIGTFTKRNRTSAWIRIVSKQVSSYGKEP